MVGAIEVGTELASAGLGKFGAKIVGSNTKLGKVLANSKFGGFDILKISWNCKYWSTRKRYGRRRT